MKAETADYLAKACTTLADAQKIAAIRLCPRLDCPFRSARSAITVNRIIRSLEGSPKLNRKVYFVESAFLVAARLNAAPARRVN
jgi:hypothetical protein